METRVSMESNYFSTVSANEQLCIILYTLGEGTQSKNVKKKN